MHQLLTAALTVLVFAGSAFANANVNVSVNTSTVLSERITEVEQMGGGTYVFPDPLAAPEVVDEALAIETALVALGNPPGTSASVVQSTLIGTDSVFEEVVMSSHNPIDDPTVVIGDPNDYSTWIAIGDVDVQVDVEQTTTNYEFYRLTVALAPPCGDGTVQAGEDCDDGNTEDGDCCSSTCAFESAGSSCEDGAVCTAADTCDGAGSCTSGGPSAICVSDWAKATLLVNEKKPGKEKILAKLVGGPSLLQSDFGNPEAGSTVYDVCLFDDQGELITSLTVDRAGASCAGKPCWKAKKDTGWQYKDKDASSDGVTKMKLFGGPGKNQVQVLAGNNEKKDQLSMPTGVAAALTDTSSVTLQVRANNAQCFGVTVDQVKKQQTNFFKAIRK